MAFHFGPDDRRLFGVFHPADGFAQAAVLLCPPLLHELQRSYRFFAGVAGLLAGSGLACLRFDYFGTGDSAGESTAFHPSSVRTDLLLAAEALRARTDGAPLILLGVRASALFARAHAADVHASAVWLWQPVLDADGYLDELDALDARERASRERYPLRRGRPAPLPGERVGTVLPPTFAEELRAVARAPEQAGSDAFPLPVAVLDCGGPGRHPVAASAHVPLPDVLAGWVAEVELDGVLPLRAARSAVDMLAADLVQWI